VVPPTTKMAELSLQEKLPVHKTGTSGKQWVQNGCGVFVWVSAAWLWCVCVSECRMAVVCLCEWVQNGCGVFVWVSAEWLWCVCVSDGRCAVTVFLFPRVVVK
jgi:hypothetical protein